MVRFANTASVREHCGDSISLAMVAMFALTILKRPKRILLGIIPCDLDCVGNARFRVASNSVWLDLFG